MQERAIQTRDCILDATAQLLLERGAEGTTTNHIAERAGYSVGTLYQHFKNKQEIYRELMGRVLNGPAEALMAFQPLPTLAETLSLVLDTAREALVDHDPALWRVLNGVPGGEFAQLRQHTMEQVIVLVEALLEHHSDEVLRSDKKIAARLLVAAVEGFALSANRTLFVSETFKHECLLLIYSYLSFDESNTGKAS